MKTPDDVLARPVEEAARLFALAFLEEARAAAPRLATEDDTEALHDFRVGLRRLRSTLRAYRPYLQGALKKSLTNELRELASATGGGRDAEVLLAWVEGQRENVLPRERFGIDWLVSQLEARRDAGYVAVREGAAPRFETLATKLHAALELYSVPMRLGEKRSVRTLAASLGELVRAHADKLGARLAEVRESTDEAAGHEARIAAKRLRYLLEPLREHATGAKELVRELKDLQEVLGELHDLHVLARELGDAASHAAAERARRLHQLALRDDAEGGGTRRAARDDERHGLTTLAKRVKERSHLLFQSVKRRFLGIRTERLVARVHEFAAGLESFANAGHEIERKYLLSGLPAEAAAAPAKQILQGYIPGDKLIERLRKVVGPDGHVACFRTVKLGAGVVRIEVEEETPLELFRKLWPLTKGKRVSKRRHVVPVGARVWEIDVFLDRSLMLAEIELKSADEEVSIPEWLAPYVVREVTDESEYVNARLAK